MKGNFSDLKGSATDVYLSVTVERHGRKDRFRTGSKPCIRAFFFDFELQQFGGSIVFRGNLKRDDLSKYVKVSDAFTAEIMNIWSEITYDANVNSIDHFLSMSV